MTTIKLSIILPVYNKQNSIAHVLSTIKKVIGNDLHTINYEIICVDDCSTDESLQILNTISDPFIKIIGHQKNQGQLKAIETGLKFSKSETIAIYSCDMQNSFHTIPLLYNAIQDGYDLAVGYRAVRSDSGFVVLLSRMFFKILSLFEKKMPEGGFDYGLFNESIKKKLLQKDFSNIFLQLEALRVSKQTFYLPTERIIDKFDKSSWTMLRRVFYAFKTLKYLYKNK